MPKKKYYPDVLTDTPSQKAVKWILNSSDLLHRELATLIGRSRVAVTEWVGGGLKFSKTDFLTCYFATRPELKDEFQKACNMWEVFQLDQGHEHDIPRSD